MELVTSNPTQIHFSPLAMSDAEGVFALWSDRDATSMTNWPYFTTLKDTIARLEKSLAYYENPLHFGAYSVRTLDDRFIGMAGADIVDAKRQTYDVWYFLNREVWGRGIAKLVLYQLLQEMKSSGRVKTVTATAVTVNIASWKTLEHHGFRRMGLIPGGHTQHGLKLDLFKYSLSL